MKIDRSGFPFYSFLHKIKFLGVACSSRNTKIGVRCDSKNVLSFYLDIFFSIMSHAEKWIVTTLEWPPFTCEKCPDQGAGVKVLREALKTKGIEIEFVFLPWSRAIADGKLDQYIGYYPAWMEDIQEGFTASSPLYSSPLGFIEPKSRPLKWEKLSDLKGKTIGVVQDYGNTKAFNELVKAKVILTDIATSDEINVKKVAAGRLDAAIIDINNAKWFLMNDYKAEASKIQINSKIIEPKDLHIPFNAKNKHKAILLKEAFQKISGQKIVDDYIKARIK